MPKKNCPRNKVLYSSVISSFSSFTFGINLTILCNFKEVLKTSLPENMDNLPLESWRWSLFISIYNVSRLLTNTVSSKIKFRTKYKLALSNMFYVVGFLILMFHTNYLLLLVSRIILGLAIGFTCIYVPIYLENLSPLNIRGVICSLHQLFIVFGALTGQIISSYMNDIERWKKGIAFIITYILLHTTTLFTIENEKNIADLEHTEGILSLLKNEKARLSVLTAVILNAAQQFSGIDGIMLNLGNILGHKFSQNSRNIMSIYIVFLASTILFMFLVDKFGRKPLLLASTSLNLLALLLLGFSQYTLFGVRIFFFWILNRFRSNTFVYR